MLRECESSVTVEMNTFIKLKKGKIYFLHNKILLYNFRFSFLYLFKCSF